MKNIFSNIPILKTNKYYSTQELSKLFKANESTIKRWADSGKLKCFKTPGGHRKYTTEGISEFISNFRYEIIPTEIDFTSGEEQAMLGLLLEKNDFSTLSEVFFNEAIKAEKENLYSILKECHSANVPLVTIYDEVVGKAVKMIIKLKQERKITPSEEQLSRTSLLESLFQFRLLSQKIVFTNRVAICFTVASGIEEVGLTSAAHLLEVTGWRVRNLGSNTNIDVVLDAVKKNSPALICTSADLFVNQNISADSIAGLRKSCSEANAQVLFAHFDSHQAEAVERAIHNFSFNKFSSFSEMLTLVNTNR